MSFFALILGLLIATPASTQTQFRDAGVLCGLEGPAEVFAAEVAPCIIVAHEQGTIDAYT